MKAADSLISIYGRLIFTAPFNHTLASDQMSGVLLASVRTHLRIELHRC